MLLSSNITKHARFATTDCFNCSNRFVFVNLDACMASQAVTLGVIERLKVTALLPFNNLSALTATPGGSWRAWLPRNPGIP